mgnify:CR=1 FL=1
MKRGEFLELRGFTGVFSTVGVAIVICTHKSSYEELVSSRGPHVRADAN